MCFTGNRILIVEDTKCIALLLEATFRQEGCIVDVVETAEAALTFYEAAQTSPTKIALILADKRLPGKDGDTLLPALQQTEYCPPIVLMSADGSDETRANCLQAGAVAFFAKPFDVSQLKAFVRNILRHNRQASGLNAPKSFEDKQAKLVVAYEYFLRELSVELQGAVSYTKLKSLLHKIRGSAALYGLLDLSETSRALSEELAGSGVSVAPRVKQKFRAALQSAYAVV